MTITVRKSGSHCYEVYSWITPPRRIPRSAGLVAASHRSDPLRTPHPGQRPEALSAAQLQ
jgi:hypothetical protein